MHTGGNSDFLGASGVVALAHRGGFSADAPPGLENTLLAFRGAVAMGYRYLETDVHVSADGVLYAFHDEHLDRVTDAHGAIASFRSSSLDAVRVAGREPIPTMDALLEEFPHARFNIDLKAPGTEEPLAELIRRHGATERVCVGSFDGRRLARFRKLTRGEVVTSASVPEVLRTRLGLPVPGAPAAFQVPLTHRGVRVVTPRFVAAAHRAGKAVHVWTVNDPDVMNDLLDLGVDGLVSDDIATLKRVLAARNLWETA